MSGPKFKVDKLGWYRTRKGDKIEVLAIKPPHKFKNKQTIIGIDCNCTPKSYFEDGRYYFYCKKSKEDLIKYIGPELLKEPRKFEFDGWMGECYDDKGITEHAIHNIIGHFCSYIYIKNVFKKYDFDKISKWHVTMTEILED